jgi:hypothetical protein
MICPKCGETENIERSHSRGPLEKILKKITPLRAYRCHSCNWRGWLIPQSRGSHLSPRSYKVVALVFMIGLLFGLLLALYFSWRDPGSGGILP